MKQKINQTIKVLLLLLLMAIVSCEKEDLSMDHPNVNSEHELPFTFKSVTLNGQSLKQFSPTIGRRVDQLNAGTFQKSSNQNTTIIDTSYVKVLQSEEFDSYIFRVTDSTLSNNHYKNYVIVEIRDSIVNQYMVNYYLDESNAIDTSLSTVEPIFGDDLINQVQYKCGGSNISVTWVDGYYTENRCSAGGEHTVGDGAYSASNPGGCQAWGTTQMATRSYTAGSWQTQTIAAEPCSGGGGGGGSSSGGGGSSGGGSNNNPPDDDDPETIGIGIVPNLPPLTKNPCQHLDKLLANSVLKQNIQSLKTPTTLSLNYEKGFQISSTSTGGFNTNPIHGNTNSNSITVTIDQQNGTTTGFIHTHYNGLVPNFSIEDIKTFSAIYQWRKYRQKPLDQLTIMVVSNGGVYALVIDDESKFSVEGRKLHEPQFAAPNGIKDNYDKIFSKPASASKVERLMIDNNNTLSKYGLSLMKAKNDLSGWDKVKINQNNSNTTSYEDCK